MDENTITRHHMESMKLTTEFHAHRLAIWHWVLLRASPPCRFYTSDNPIVQWGTVDETASFSEDINETSEVYLPLTPRLTLLALKPHVESPALGSID